MKTSIFPTAIFVLVFGALLGTAAGLLYAPQSGRTTRTILMTKGVQVQDKVNENIRVLSVQYGPQIHNLSTGMQNLMRGLSAQLKTWSVWIDQRFSSKR